MNNRKRKQGEGTLRLRKDGRWEGRVVIGYDDKGKPKTKSVLAHTKGECVEKLESLKEECGRTAEKLKPDMPFGEWIDKGIGKLRSGIRAAILIGQRSVNQ